MGWKASSIIIDSTINIDPSTLLNKLGYINLKKIEDQPYEVAINPEGGKIFIGTYKNKLIISIDGLSVEFFDTSLSNIEKKLISLFPEGEIFAFSLQSTINHWGFAVIKDGQKIRIKAGDSDNGTVIDFGEPLREELHLLSKSKMDNNGERRYYFETNSEEPYYEDQVGENIIFDVFERYTGTKLDEDDDLMETLFAGYEFEMDTLSPMEEALTGKWIGHYIYGEGYPEEYQGEKETFMMDLNFSKGMLNGVCIDDNKQSDEPATIDGFMNGNFVGFVKKYQHCYILEENGETVIDDSRPPFGIEYAGLFDQQTATIKGIWKIQDTDCAGGWLMKKIKNQ